ncbi:MAG: UDP-N-acetylmuramoyl-L-alanine--D-glutamate ligase [Alphaproteobacteria bacterium]|nr:UDP-N-acetylmuramoyl-L-alanine--D-glutamate ligase [Alphaproteobacteria bacterium]
MAIALPFFQGLPVAVLGLGVSGLPTARALKRSGAIVTAWDDGAAAREQAAAEGIPVSDLLAIDWREQTTLVISPGIPHTHPKPHPVAAAARAAGAELICDVELLARASPAARFLGITGTNGKSTTTALTGHVLKVGGMDAEVGGNIGVAALDLHPVGPDGIYVLEMSSYQLELVSSLTFDIAVLLNVTPDHLDRHGGMDGYVAAKRRVFHRQTKPRTAVVGVDDEISAGICRALQRADEQVVVPISAKRAVERGVYVLDGVLHDALQGAPQQVMDLKPVRTLQGEHNWQNAAAAYVAARAAGLAPPTIAACIRSFPGLAHRQETVAVIDGIAFVNDSKATNADAAAKALGAYAPVYWIAGGRPKEGGIASLEPWFLRIRHAYLIGEAAEDFAATLAGKVPRTLCGTLDKAVAAAFAQARADGMGGTVLLSPACASWDQFKNFEHRGAVFRQLVEALPGARGPLL